MRWSFKVVAFLLFSIVLFVKNSQAQSVSITTVDPGPYTPGSSIAVRIAIPSGLCLDKTNIFSLQLSDASGNFIAPYTTIGQNTGFNFNGSYATFINGVIPAGTAVGINYKVRVVTSNIVTTGTPSAAFAIVAGQPVTAGTATTPVLATSPETVFGNCIGQPSSSFYFQNNSTNALTAGADLYNDANGTQEGGTGVQGSGLGLPGYMTAINTTNFTVFVKAVSAVGVGTKAYLLLNNVTRTNFGASAQGPVCLQTTNGTTSATATFSTDYTTSTGIENNYPGMLYTINWGDGNTNTYTFCQIKAAAGSFNHGYTQSSCGKTGNAYSISFTAASPFCSNIVSPITTSQAVLAPPTNSLTGPLNVCTNTPATFKNTSSPGQSVNGTGSNCTDASAKYSWLVDGVVQQSGTAAGSTFTWTFTTHGNHTITIHYDNSSTAGCTPADKTLNICVQDAPVAKFNLSTNTICNPGSVNITNASTIDNICSSGYTYQYTVTPATGFTLGGGTHLTDASPVLNFTTAGKYTVKLQVSPPSPAACPSNIYVDTIYVNGPPVAQLSADFLVCGANKTFKFSNTAGPTQTMLTGTYQTLPTTYNWVVTPPTGGSPATFGPGTSSSQYPTITFPDFGTYTITVTQTNGCNTSTATQKITFQDAPTINATGPASPICPDASAQLSATVSNTTYVTGQPTWSGGTGTFSDPHLLNTSYTPSAADIQAGSVMLTISQPTSLGGSCSIVSDNIVLNIYPKNTITSAAAQSICNGSPLNYSITSTVNQSTFTWTAVGSANASGFATSGSGNTINEPSIVTTTPTANATVTYTITPHANGCDGTPFTFTVTVNPTPTLTATPPATTICSNTSTAIALSSNLSTTKYTWTFAPADGSVSGYSQPSAGISATQIADMLVNNTTAPLQVTYTITAHNNGCDSPPVTVNLNVQPKITASANPPASVCSGSSAGIVLSSSPAGTTFTWTATPSNAANISGYTSNNTPTTNNQIQDVLTVSGTGVETVTYVITPHNNGCDGTPLTYTISVAPLPALTATAASNTICSNQPSAITLTSNLTTAKYTWTATASNGNITGFSGQATPTSINQIQQILKNSGTTSGTVTYTVTAVNGATANNCPGQSASVTITVQPATVIANAGPDDNVCGVTSYQLKGNNLGPNANGMWTLTSGQSGITFTDAFLYNTIANGLVPGQSYTFRWTSKGAAPCGDSFDEVIINDQVANIKAAFTADHITGCGTSTINFTNTSTNTAGLTYAWNFGNGVTSTLQNPPAVTYAAQSNGKDSVYTVTLRITNQCSTDVTTQTITVKPQKPVVSINPDKTLTCAPFILNVQNLSPGTNQTYTFFLTDANGMLITKNVKTDKTDQQFQIINPGTYKVYMIGQNECGTAQTATYTVVATQNTATPRLTIDGNAGTGCAPLTVVFHNNSTGTTGYRYDWGDGTNSLVTTNTNDVTHTFTKGGTYSVVLHASNGCTADIASAPVVINVLYQPTVAFTPDITTGCKQLKVHFTNTTTDPSTSQVSDLTYDWDFGDGSAHSHEINPTHTYSFKNSPFTVTLTATNATGCSNVLTKSALITVNSSPITAFTAKPDSVISIPNYTFSFLDQSTGNPVNWKWSFGDGNTSTSQNPNHTYADTGLYKVTLTALNIYCDSTISHHVRITGVPGQVYLPNAFTPNSVDPDLRTFIIKGSGLKTWHLQIFNNYGQLLWETTKLSDKGVPLESWDGTFNGQPLPQGVYVWQATGTFINGNEWKGMSYNGSAPKHVGVIHLLR